MPVIVPPPRWKQLLATLSGAYPLVVLLSAFVLPRLTRWPLLVRSAVLPVVLLTLMTYVIMPPLTRFCEPGSTHGVPGGTRPSPELTHYGPQLVGWGDRTTGEAQLLIAWPLIAVAGLSALARLLSVPYPIVLVLGGAAFRFIPGTPKVRLDPQARLVIFLPPLLYGASIFANFGDMRANVRRMPLSTIGLVLATTGRGRLRCARAEWAQVRCPALDTHSY